MRFSRILGGCFLGWAALVSVQAQTNAVRPLTLPECVRLAMEHNFDVKIERLSPAIARFNLEGSRSYYDPVLQGSFEQARSTREGAFNSSIGFASPDSVSESQTLRASLVGSTPWGMTYDVGPSYSHRSGSSGGSSYDYFDGQFGASISQPLLRNFQIDQGRQNILLARKNLKISETALAGQIMIAVSQVEQAYYDLVFAGENIKVQEKALELAERLREETRKRVEVGTLAPLEEKQAESQVAARRADLLAAQQTAAAQQNVLKNLLTDNYAEWHDVDIVPKEKLVAMPERHDLAESWRRGLTQRPDLQQMKIDLEKRDVTLRYQRNQTLPSVNLTGSLGDTGKDNVFGGVLEDQVKWRSPFYSVGVVFSMPLSNRGPRQAYKAGQAEKEQAVLRVKQLEQDIMVQIDDAIKQARSHFERIGATRKAREYAEAALEAELKKLDAGKSTSFVVLQLQNDLTAARFAEIRALADYNKTLSQLAFSEGSTLEKNRISLDAK